MADNETIVWDDGTKFWKRNGKLHREDGPAVEWAHGGREWWFEGEKHRLDGPATEWPDGRKWRFFHNHLVKKEGFKTKPIEIDEQDAGIICTALCVAEHESMIDAESMERIANTIRKVFPKDQKNIE